MIISIKKNICIVHLLTLFGKNSNIIDVAKSNFFIYFYQTTVSINSNSSIGIILIAFE
jgi:hypothetical protein